MDFINKQLGGGQPSAQQQSEQFAAGNAANAGQGGSQQQQGGFLGNLMNKANTAAGGGPESESREDYLDKGIDFVQQHALGQGAQNNESAIEQAKDEQISDFIRGQYKGATGKEFPVADKS